MHSAIAVIFDWESYWSLEACVGPTQGLHYPDEVHRFYQAFHAFGLNIDIIPSTASLQQMRQYAVVVAPTLIMVKSGVAQTLAAYVREGGRLVTGYMSGLHNEQDRIVPGGYPGELRELAGVWVEEIDALAPNANIPVAFTESAVDQSTADEAPSDATTGSIVASIMHLEGAQPVAVYGGDSFYAHTPAVTVHAVGKGQAWYVGTALDKAGMQIVAQRVLDGSAYHGAALSTTALGTAVLDADTLETGVLGTDTLGATVLPEGVDIARRWADDGSIYMFVINLTADSKHVSIPELAGAEVVISPVLPDTSVSESASESVLDPMPDCVSESASASAFDSAQESTSIHSVLATPSSAVELDLKPFAVGVYRIKQ